MLGLERGPLVAGRRLVEVGGAEALVQRLDPGLRGLDLLGEALETRLELLALPIGRAAAAALPLARGPAVLPRLPLRGARLAEHHLGVEVIVAAALQVLLVAAGKVVDALRRDLDDARRQLADEPAIVGHEDQRAVVGLEGAHQRLDGLEVEVVGGLVEQQDVGLLDHLPREDQPRGLAAREGLELLAGLVLREEDRRQVPLHEADGLARTDGGEPRLDGLAVLPELRLLVLRDVAGMGLVAPLDGARVRLDLAHRHLEEGRLADPVRPDDGDALAPHDGERDVLEHPVLAVALAHARHLEHLPAAGPALLEAELRIAPRALGERLDLDPVDRLELALRLAGLGGLGAEALDEGLVLGDLRLALLDLALPSLALLALGPDEGLVVSRVGLDRGVVDVDDRRGDVVEEPVVVRDHQRRPLEVLQELLEPADRHDVEVVGRLVEQQHVGLRGQHLREQHAELEAAGERGEGLLVGLGRDAEPLEDLAGARLQRVAVVLDDDVLELGVAVAVEVLLGPGEDALLLGHGLPERRVAHHHDVDDADVLVLEVVLPEDSDPRALRDRDLAVARALLAAEDLEQRRLAAAVRAHDAVALARIELERDSLEEGLVPEVLGEVRHRDHGARRITAGVMAVTAPRAGAGEHPGGEHPHGFSTARAPVRGHTSGAGEDGGRLHLGMRTIR